MSSVFLRERVLVLQQTEDNLWLDKKIRDKQWTCSTTVLWGGGVSVLIGHHLWKCWACLGVCLVIS